MPVKVPTCVGFIMDGNRRWARERGLPVVMGHKQGGQVFANSIAWLKEAGVQHAVYYAFSTENWKRSETEVAALLELFRSQFIEIKKLLAEHDDVRLRVIGRRTDFDAALQEQIMQLEESSASAATARFTIWIALSYGGRAEIIAAVQAAISDGEPVDETSFAKLLWTADMPDPDIIVRAGGEYRLSNFMTWQSVYSELVFLDMYWPDFTKAELTKILEKYAARQRRFGT